MQKEELRPIQHLNRISKKYPQIWKIVESVLAARGKKPSLEWPDWCFMPASCWNIIEKKCIEMSGQKASKRHSIIPELTAIGTWRYTQGIYRFDQDLLKALSETEMSGDLPCDVLLRLPEWCIYIETPGMIVANVLPLTGIWVHLNCFFSNKNPSIRFVLQIDTWLLSFGFDLGTWSLQEAVAKITDIAVQEKINTAEEAAEISAAMVKCLQSLLPLVLYICSDEPDIKSPLGTTSRRPELKKTKKGLRLFPPDKPTIWRVGETIGRVLRQTRTEVSATGNSPGHSPRPHIRRAHWHGYWTGNGAEKRFKYNWLSPIVVRGREHKEQGGGQARL